MLKPLGILGGTFDPIHFGHLRMALELYEIFQLEKVLFIPSFLPMHRQSPLADAESRLKMVELALQSAPHFQADAHEIHRKMPLYAIDTLIALRQAMPQQPFAFLVGMDAFLQLTTWHRYQELFTYTHFIVATRPHFTLPTSGEIAKLVRDKKKEDPAYLHQHLAGGIFFQTMTILDIGATHIRELIAHGKSIRYLLPDAVCEYIETHQLYTQLSHSK